MDSPGNYKRRRTLLVSSASINDLSADLCCIVADFLPKTSRALLAVALTAKSSSFREGWKGQPSNVSKAIISRTKAGRPFSNVLDEICKEDQAEAETKGKHRKLKIWMGHEQTHDQLFRQCLSKQLKEYYNSQWEMVDFIDIPVSLASRLTDDDVAAILLCIDAKRNLKQLKFTHCSNVVGQGLEPLRGSTVLEKLDLGLVRQFEAPYLHQTSGGRSDDFLFDDAKLSEGPVCDIIDSILREEGDSFKRLQYPYKWSDKSSEPDNLVPIYDKNVLRSERMMQLFVDEHGAIVNKFACCLYFGFEDEEDFCGLIWDADLVDACIDCHTDTYAVCSNCNDIVCFECCKTEECDVCNINYCPRCARDNGFENVVSWCEAAGYGSDCPPYCSSCRVSSCRNGTNSCTECRSKVFDALLDECNTKQVQIDSQNDEMERLRSVIEGLAIQVQVQADRVQTRMEKQRCTKRNGRPKEEDLRGTCIEKRSGFE